MSERQGQPVTLTEHELSEIRMLIEERTSIRFDESRQRFFSTRVREHMAKKSLDRGTDLLRAIKKTNFEFQEFLESLLTQETSFFRYPSVFEAFEKRVLPELHIRKFWKNPRSLRRLFHRRRTLFHCDYHRRRNLIFGRLERRNTRYRYRTARARDRRTRGLFRP